MIFRVATVVLPDLEMLRQRLADSSESITYRALIYTNVSLFLIQKVINYIIWPLLEIFGVRV